jgi:hypothetical protein
MPFAGSDPVLSDILVRDLRNWASDFRLRIARHTKPLFWLNRTGRHYVSCSDYRL